MKKNQIKKINRQNNKPHGISQIDNHDNNIIELRGVNKYYINGKNIYHVLKNIHLSIERGKFILIYGKSGTGKSTLLNVISGLDRASEGEVVVKNINLSSLKDAELTKFRRKNIGFIFQSYNLLSDLNARDNARMGQVLQDDKSKRISIEKLFADMGMADLLTTDIRDLSGGQQQRVAIARALSKNPELIFADEPTGSLDSFSSLKVMELLKEINKNYGTTIIVITHDETYKKFADQVLEVKDGEIIVAPPLLEINEKIIEPEQIEAINEIVN